MGSGHQLPAKSCDDRLGHHDQVPATHNQRRLVKRHRHLDILPRTTSTAAGNGLGSTINHLRRTTRGGGLRPGENIKYLRRTTSCAAGYYLGTTAKYLRGAAGIGLGTAIKYLRGTAGIGPGTAVYKPATLNERRRKQLPAHHDQVPAQHQGHRPGHHDQVPATQDERRSGQRPGHHD
jgi:hypothetical protein